MACGRSRLRRSPFDDALAEVSSDVERSDRKRKAEDAFLLAPCLRCGSRELPLIGLCAQRVHGVRSVRVLDAGRDAPRDDWAMEPALHLFQHMRCECSERLHRPKLVVLTGGPGAGKTAVLEMIHHAFCEHVVVLPEAASVLFGGGFPRHDTEAGRRAAQQAIFHVQRSMESMVVEEQRVAVALCDRGTLDGLAYWPGGTALACDALGIRRGDELLRYSAVIHLRTPVETRGYDHSNPLRMESAREAAQLDERTLAAWDGHPRRVIIESTDDFLAKVARAVAAIRAEVPTCCRKHGIRELGETTSSHVCAPAK